MSGEHIYKIMAADEWDAAKAKGTYEGSAHDRRDGFIHFSTAEQVAETAARHFAGQSALVLLTVDTAVLGDALKWEPSRDGALFPHLYGPLPSSAVIARHDLPLGSAGHRFPAPLGES